MKNNKIIIFTLITIVVVIAAVFMSQQRSPTTALPKQALFPGLLDKVNDVSSLTLIKQDKSLTLVRQDKHWVIEQADNYPADFGKIRETVIAVSDLLVLAEKTSDVERYERLGVEDPSSNSASSLLSLLDDDGKSLASLIVGGPRHSKSAENKSGLYVRLPDTQPALLVEGRLEVDVEVKEWFTRELFSIDAGRIKQIEIVPVDDKVVKLGRENDFDDFTLENIPEGMETQSSTIISRMGTMLENVRADDVMKVEKLASASQSSTTITTFDGLIVTINNSKVDDTGYSSFSFAFDENSRIETKSESEEAESAAKSEMPSPAEESLTLNQQLSGWAYAIPAYKYELFARKLEQLIKEIEPTEEAENESPSAASE